MTNWRGVCANAAVRRLRQLRTAARGRRLLEGGPAPRDPAACPAADHHRHRAVLRVPAQRGRAAAAAAAVAGVWGSKFYRVVFFFPQVLAVRSSRCCSRRSTARRDRPDQRPADAVGLDPVLFLADPNLALWSIIGVLVWQAVGFYVVLFSAGMASIPRRSTRPRRSTAPAGSACSSGSPCRCSGTPSRWPGSTWASRRSTRSPSCRCSRSTRAARTAPPRCSAWRSTATPSSIPDTATPRRWAWRCSSSPSRSRR